MIRYLKGIYAMTTETGIVVETPAGIGFSVNIPMGSPLYKHGEGEEIMVYTEMVVREDDMSLFGFHNRESLEFFKLLTTVNGIGPKGAMSIMGSMPLEQLKQAIIFGDVKTVSQAQGVGKKTAERLVLELKDKVGNLDNELNPSLAGAFTDTASDSTDNRTEAVDALTALGYSKAEAFGAVGRVPDEGLNAEEYIKRALKNLF